MPPKIIKLGKRDDITSAIKHIKSVKDKDVVFEVAKGSILLSSSDTLKLLKRTGDAMGKSVKIATDDEVGQILAKKAGVLLGNQDVKMPKASMRKVSRSDIRPKFSDILGGKKPAARVSAEPDKISIQEPEEEDSDQPLIASSYSKTFKPKSNFWKWVTAVGVVVILVLAAIVFLPSATITVTARSEQIARDVEITVDKNLSSVNSDALQIPGVLVTKEVSQTKNFRTTGVKLSGTKATGTISIYNQTANTLKFKSATTSFLANGKKFLLASDVSGIKSNGVTAGINIIAEQPGNDYNLAANTKFQIVNAALGNLNVYAINTTDLSGGAATSTPMISQADIDQAAATLSDAVVAQAETNLSSETGVTTKLLPSGLTKEILAQTANKNVGDMADNFDMTLIARISGLSFKDADVNYVVLAKINQVLSSDKYLLDSAQNQYTANFKTVDLTKGQGIMAVHYQTTAAYKVDSASLSKLLAGKSESEIKEILLSKPEIDDVSVSFWPSWFVHKAPQFNGKVYVKSTVSQ